MELFIKTLLPFVSMFNRLAAATSDYTGGVQVCPVVEHTQYTMTVVMCVKQKKYFPQAVQNQCVSYALRP